MRDMIEKMNDWSLEDFFDGLFEPTFYGRRPAPAMHMKTDVKEDEHGYELDIDLPGFEKNEIDVSLKNGYLNVSAKKGEKQDDANNTKETECGCEHKNDTHCKCDNPKRFIKRERSYFASRSYYVGDKVKDEDIKAKYQNGVLSLYVPKQQPKQIESHKINID